MRIPLSTSIHPSSSTSSIQVPHVVNKNSSSLSSFRYPSSSFPSILDCRPSIVVSSSSFIYPFFFISLVRLLGRDTLQSTLGEASAPETPPLLSSLFISSPSCINVLSTFDHPSISSISSSSLVLSRIDSCFQSRSVPLPSVVASLYPVDIHVSLFSYRRYILPVLSLFYPIISASVSTFFQRLSLSLSPMHPRTSFLHLINSHLNIQFSHPPTLAPPVANRHHQ